MVTDWSPPEVFFSDAFITQLFADHQIPSDKQSDVRSRLDHAAVQWRDSSLQRHSLNERKSILAEISQTAATFKEQLEDFPDYMWDDLIHTNRYKCDGIPGETRIDYADPSPVGMLAAPEPYFTRSGTGPCSTETQITRSDLFAVLEVLSEAGRIAPHLLPEVKRGKESDWPLRLWVTAMHNLWKGTLHRKFTRHIHKGDPISEAACFCADVFAKLSPNTSPEPMFNEMKKLIKEQRQLFSREE